MLFNRNNIIFYGYSIGSGPSVTLASLKQYPCKGLILHSAITSGLSTLFKDPISSKYDIFPNIDLI